MEVDILEKVLRKDEGERARPYTDSTGNITIGVGHNLTARGLSRKVIEQILIEDIEAAWDQAERIIPQLVDLSEPRQVALVSLVFNLGEKGFRAFKKTIKAIHNKQWEEAGNELLNSLWAKQVGKRAHRIKKMLVNEEYDSYYKLT